MLGFFFYYFCFLFRRKRGAYGKTIYPIEEFYHLYGGDIEDVEAVRREKDTKKLSRYIWNRRIPNDTPS
jgi:hypothetical protein